MLLLLLLLLLKLQKGCCCCKVLLIFHFHTSKQWPAWTHTHTHTPPTNAGVVSVAEREGGSERAYARERIFRIFLVESSFLPGTPNETHTQTGGGGNFSATFRRELGSGQSETIFPTLFQPGCLRLTVHLKPSRMWLSTKTLGNTAGPFAGGHFGSL